MTKTTLTLKLDPRDPDLSKIRDLARASREGKIIAFPTETVYGIGGPASIADLDARISQIKKREPGKSYSYHIGGWEMIDLLKVDRTPAFRFLTRSFWPGPLTLIAYNQNREKIGLRFPRHRITAALINAVGEPFLGTSANVSGQPSPYSAADVLKQLDGQIDYLIDSGRTELAKDSTIVDLTGDEPVVVREGADLVAISAAIEKVKSGRFPRKKILFVCTGNSCRSPMAAGWLMSELRRKGLQDQIEVVSCGIGARLGGTATPEAIFTMRNREIDISAHRSKPCNREDVMDADLIYAMGPEHSAFISNLMPAMKNKIRTLNISDPIGMGVPVYEEVVHNIEKKLKEYWDEITA